MKPSDAKSWTVSLSQTLAPSTVSAVYRRLGQIMADAVHDGIIPRSPLNAWVEPPEGHYSPVGPYRADEAFPAIHKAGSGRWADPLEELRGVARVHLDPRNRGRQRKAVAEWLGGDSKVVSDETASRRIKAARQASLIPAKGATEDELRTAFAVSRTTPNEMGTTVASIGKRPGRPVARAPPGRRRQGERSPLCPKG